MMFRIRSEPITEPLLTDNPAAGARAGFEGTVRNLNDGQAVIALEYEAYEPLASAEGARILDEAVNRFSILEAACVHRTGRLKLSDIAVRVEVLARHRREAFAACEWIVDELKRRVPIWKREVHADGASEWVNATSSAQGADDEHEFYRRQMKLPEVGAEGQARLKFARILVVGAGGLGCPALTYLAAAGVGKLIVVDSDVVEASNLHRQPLFSYQDRGRPKAEVAAEKLRALNPFTKIEARIERVIAETVQQLFDEVDIVLDGTDNFETKFLLSDAAIQYGKPVVSASVYQFEGQLMTVRPGGPCLRCLWPETPARDCVGSCADVGILGSTAGVFGALQAGEALKMLLNMPGQLRGEMLTFDLRTLQTSRLRVPKAASCPACVEGRMSEPAKAGPMEIEPTADLSSYRVIDVRELVETEIQPLEGSIKMPMSAFDPSQLPEGELAIVCQHGVRSLRVTRYLREIGRERVVSVRGGVAEMQGKDLV